MHRAQVIADLSFELAEVASTEEALGAIRRALRATGLDRATTLDEGDVTRLLFALVAEGGPIQTLAEHIAVTGLSGAADLDPEAA